MVELASDESVGSGGVVSDGVSIALKQKQEKYVGRSSCCTRSRWKHNGARASIRNVVKSLDRNLLRRRLVD